MFYPAGSLYALTEETYRLGLYGLCNTERLRDIYTERYGGTGHAFTPAVDRTCSTPRAAAPTTTRRPARVPLRPARALAELLGAGRARPRPR